MKRFYPFSRRTTTEYCIRHGHQEFFLGYEHDDEGQCLGQSLHCPLCFPEHEDNPANAPEAQYPHPCSPAGEVCSWR